MADHENHENEPELYYNITITDSPITIHLEAGSTFIINSGKPTDPDPPGGSGDDD